MRVSFHRIVRRSKIILQHAMKAGRQDPCNQRDGFSKFDNGATGGLDWIGLG